jgi:hypothetical protein
MRNSFLNGIPIISALKLSKIKKNKTFLETEKDYLSISLLVKKIFR